MYEASLPGSIDVSDPGASTSFDRYGNPIPGAPTTVTIDALVEPMDATEEEIGRDTRVSRYAVTTRPDAPVTGRSSIAWEGRSLEVVGEPLHTSEEGLRLMTFTAREITE